MTDKEKVRAYDEALDKAKKELNACGSQDCDAARQIYRFFPQLKESEDEQSKKWILEYLYDGMQKCDEEFKGQYKTAIAWLEKQGQVKESEIFQHENKTCEENGDSLTQDNDEQKPAEWGEEDEIKLKTCISLVEMFYGGTIDKSDKDRLLDWLKSLRPQNQWKPTKEQLIELRHAISGCSVETTILLQLEEDLKKLL